MCDLMYIILLVTLRNTLHQKSCKVASGAPQKCDLSRSFGGQPRHDCRSRLREADRASSTCVNICMDSCFLRSVHKKLERKPTAPRRRPVVVAAEAGVLHRDSPLLAVLDALWHGLSSRPRHRALAVEAGGFCTASDARQTRLPCSFASKAWTPLRLVLSFRWDVTV
jgi:hypothetical protein